MNTLSSFTPNTRQLITKQDLGKVYIDMQGQQRTIDRRIVGETLVAYIVTNKWGKSEIKQNSACKLAQIGLVFNL